jgi:hypothetical protein
LPARRRRAVPRTTRQNGISCAFPG